MMQQNILGRPYPLTEEREATAMRDRILLTATVLFAQQGFAAVSVRDIARQVGIRPASLYSHFKSKEELLDAILEHLQDLYLSYFGRLDVAIRQAASFAEVLDCMFLELRQVVNLFTYYGFSLIQAEQFRDKTAYSIYRDTFLSYSIAFLRDRFDQCVAKGWARPFNTGAVATSFMHSVLIGITLRAHEGLGDPLPFDITEMFTTLQALLLDIGRIG